MTMPHTIDLCDDLMCVLDQDGHGLDCHELRSLRAAKRQLRRWQDEYTFNYAAALRDVSEFFAVADTAAQKPIHAKLLKMARKYDEQR